MTGREVQTLLLFMDTYPSELGASAAVLRDAIAQFPVAAVDMGHTHYKELANDGHTIYMATRSTGQIEEGPVGFSISTLDRCVVSWNLTNWAAGRSLRSSRPADRTLIIEPRSPLQVVRDTVEIRVRIRGGGERAIVTTTIDDANFERMSRVDQTNLYRVTWPSTREPVRSVRSTSTGRSRDNALGANPEKGVLGSRLGPNANGRKW